MKSRVSLMRIGEWVLAIAGAAGTAVAAALAASQYVILIGAVTFAAGIALIVKDVMAAARERSEERAKTLDRLLVRWPLYAKSVRLADLEIPLPAVEEHLIAGGRNRYIKRDLDVVVRRALEEHRFVLIVGKAKAGKSRTALEVISRGRFADYPLAVPAREARDTGALRELFKLSPPLGDGHADPPILWLDDLEVYLEKSALTLGNIDEWVRANPGARIVATIRTGAYLNLRELELRAGGAADDPLARTIGDVLDAAEPIELPVALSEDEQRLAAADYSGYDFGYGIGARLIDARRLVDRLRFSGDASARGVAIVRAAVDFRRVGVSRRPTASELRELHTLYAGDDAGESFDEGLAWALERMPSGSALLRADAGGYVVHDYVADSYDGRTIDTDALVPIPPETWQQVIRLVDPAEALAIAARAFGQPEEPELAATRAALDRAMASSDPEIRAAAQLNSSELAEWLDDSRAYADAYERGQAGESGAATAERPGFKARFMTAFAR